MQENEVVKLLQTVISRMDSFEEGVNKRFDDVEKGQQELRQDAQELRQGQQELRQGLSKLENRVDKLEIRLENEVIGKINALFDEREVQKDINQQMFNTLRRIEAKIDVLQMETAHIRRVK